MTQIKEKNIPLHVTIIPDGNRRWAKEHKLNAVMGHKKGADYDKLIGLCNEARNKGVKYISFWAFSTENWQREKNEVDELFKVLEDLLPRMIKDAGKNKMKFIHVGRKDRIPKKLIDELEELEKATAKFKEICVVLCLDYGGKDEIVRGINKVLKSNIKKIDEKIFSNYLDTKNMPDVDLIVRTGGEKRLSGFMPFTSSYAELYFTDVYFPDFDVSELRKALDEFARRKRNFGR